MSKLFVYMRATPTSSLAPVNPHDLDERVEHERYLETATDDPIAEVHAYFVHHDLVRLSHDTENDMKKWICKRRNASSDDPARFEFWLVPDQPIATRETRTIDVECVKNAFFRTTLEGLTSNGQSLMITSRNGSYVARHVSKDIAPPTRAVQGSSLESVVMQLATRVSHKRPVDSGALKGSDNA